MKKIIITIIVLTTFSSASAQVERNTVLVGGGTAFSYTSVNPSGDASSSTDVTLIGIKVGYFLAQDFVLGANFSHTSISNTSLTTIGGFGRYYPGGRFFLGAGYGSATTSLGNANYGVFSAEAGYAAFVGRTVAFEPAVIFTSGENYTTLGFGVGINVYLNR
jgi:hypothetical protein